MGKSANYGMGPNVCISFTPTLFYQAADTPPCHCCFSLAILESTGLNRSITVDRLEAKLERKDSPRRCSIQSNKNTRHCPSNGNYLIYKVLIIWRTWERFIKFYLKKKLAQLSYKGLRSALELSDLC